MGKKIIRVIAVVLIPVVCLYLLTLLLTPKYVNDIPEGSMIAEYYKSEKNNENIHSFFLQRRRFVFC